MYCGEDKMTMVSVIIAFDNFDPFRYGRRRFFEGSDGPVFL